MGRHSNIGCVRVEFVLSRAVVYAESLTPFTILCKEFTCNHTTLLHAFLQLIFQTNLLFVTRQDQYLGSTEKYLSR